MTPQSTLVPAAITALNSVLTNYFAPDPTLGGAVPGRGAAVVDVALRAGQPDQFYTAVSGWETTMRDPATLGAPFFFTIEEQFAVTGTVWAYVGDGTVSTARTAAAAIFSAMEAAVREDPTLGGVIRQSWFSEHKGTQGPTAQGGSAVQIDWSLHCEGRIQ